MISHPEVASTKLTRTRVASHLQQYRNNWKSSRPNWFLRHGANSPRGTPPLEPYEDFTSNESFSNQDSLKSSSHSSSESLQNTFPTQELVLCLEDTFDSIHEHVTPQNTTAHETDFPLESYYSQPFQVSPELSAQFCDHCRCFCDLSAGNLSGEGFEFSSNPSPGFEIWEH